MHDRLRAYLDSGQTSPIPAEWTETGMASVDVGLQSLTRVAILKHWSRIVPPLELPQCIRFLVNHYLLCLRADPTSTDYVLSRREAVHELARTIEHFYDTSVDASLLREALEASQQAFLVGDEDVRMAIAADFLAHVLQRPELMPMFQGWQSNPEMAEAVRFAMRWGRMSKYAAARQLDLLNLEIATDPELNDDYAEALHQVLLGAIEVGDNPLVAAVLELGADPNGGEFPDCFSPLCEAVSQGNIDAVKLLIDRDVDLTRWSIDMRSAIHIATDNNDLPMVQLLLDAGADIDAMVPEDPYETPLMIAALKNQFAMIELLLANGAQPDLKNPLGMSADVGKVKRTRNHPKRPRGA